MQYSKGRSFKGKIYKKHKNIGQPHWEKGLNILGKHENDYNYRIRNRGARLVGVLKISPNQPIIVPVDLGFEPNSIISHLQTRDEDFKWQTYYSTVPTLNNYLILIILMILQCHHGY